jgi:hypothetical protein
MVAGPLFSVLNRMQTVLTEQRRCSVRLTGSVFVVGYWRSGTTLLHNYLCLDPQFGYPTTYACMNAQHFVLTQSSALKQPSKVIATSNGRRAGVAQLSAGR